MFADFDKTQLMAVLKDFYTVTSIRITVFDMDFREIIAYPLELPPVCKILRSCSECLACCARSDQEACRIASRRKSPYTYRCHAGLTESIVPIRVDSLLIGYLFLGNVLCGENRKTLENEILSLSSGYPIDAHGLRNACESSPLKSRAYVEASSHLMQSLTNYLAICRAITLRDQDLPVKIDEYINRHFTEPIRVDDICERFHIGRSSLYELSSQNYGTGISTHIRNLRMNYAQDLLLKHPDISIAEVAEQCGFSDYNYFITVFRKYTGKSPRQYMLSEKGKNSRNH